jgi:hypothetical protein
MTPNARHAVQLICKSVVMNSLLYSISFLLVSLLFWNRVATVLTIDHGGRQVNYWYVTFYAELRIFFVSPQAKRDFQTVGSCSAVAMSSSLTVEGVRRE